MQRIAACLLIISLNAYGAEDSHPEMLRGYTAQNSATEVQWEQKLRAVPETDRLRENMRRLSARPHHVGSPYDKDNAEWLLGAVEIVWARCPELQVSPLRPPLRAAGSGRNDRLRLEPDVW